MAGRRRSWGGWQQGCRPDSLALPQQGTISVWKKLGSIRAGRRLLLGSLVVASFLEGGEDMCESTEVRTEIPPYSSSERMNDPRGGEAAAGAGWMMNAMLSVP